jgi:hypothetical protein
VITLTDLLQESPDDLLDRLTAAAIDPALAQAVIASVRSSQTETAPPAEQGKSGCLGRVLVLGLGLLWLRLAG